MEIRVSGESWNIDIANVLAARPPRIRLVLSGPIKADVLDVMVLYTALSGFADIVEVERLPDSRFYVAERSYTESAFNPLFIRGEDRVAEVSFAAPHYVTRGVICTAAEAVLSASFDTFRANVAKLLRHAEIPIPENLLGLVTRLAFETVLNAEEHGSARVGPAAIRPLVPRLLGIVHHKSTLSYLSGNVARYVEKYLNHFSRPEGGWLEVVVADGGMGVAYPGYFVVSARNGVGENLYVQPYSFERMRLEKALQRGASTKGKWGRQISTQTRPGMGMEIIRQQFGEARAFANLRSGRARVQSMYSDTLGSEHWDSSPKYLVSNEPDVCYYGTAWQLLIPITTRYELSL